MGGIANVLDVVFLLVFGAWAYLVARRKRRDEVGWAICAAVAFFLPGYAMQEVVFPALAKSRGWTEAFQETWQKPAGFLVGGACALVLDLVLTFALKRLPAPEKAEGGGPPAAGAGTGGGPAPEAGEAGAGEPAPPTQQQMAAARPGDRVSAAGLEHQGPAGAAALEPFDLLGRHWPALVVAALFVIMYIPTIGWMLFRWGRGSSYYSHGFLIPFVAAWLVWLNRKRLGALGASDDLRHLGLAVLCGGLLMHLAGTFIRAYSVQGVSFVVTLCGAVFFLCGRAMSRVLLFPLAFTITMIPLPMHVIERLTFKLKTFAASASVWVVDALRGLGLHSYVLVRVGSYIYWDTPDGKADHIIIGDVCSGLRSLIALLAFGALFAYLAKLSMARKLALFAAAVPIAILANMWRIVTLTFIGCTWGSEATHGVVHDVTGYGIFAVAFVLFFSFERLLRLFEPAGAGAACAA